MERLETAQTSLESRSAELAAMEGEEAELRAAFEQKAGDLQNELTAVRGGAGHDRRRAAGGPAGALREAARPEGRRRGGRPAPARVRGLPAHPERLRPRHHRQGAHRRGAALRGVQPDPGAHRGVRSVSRRSVIVEADGGSRGNPGPSAYGALLKDADTGELIAERGETIGVATNNVAEYRGLIAGLELAAEHAPEAEIEVRMDSKLVVEQMAGNWKIKHPSMRPLAIEANRLAPIGTTFTWVPRAENAHADRLANEALDGSRRRADRSDTEGSTPADERADPAAGSETETKRGWGPPGGAKPTTFILVRHGVTDHTTDKRFSGGLASSNPPLNDEGRRAGPGDGGVARPVVRHVRRAGQLPGAAHPPDCRDPGRVLRPRDRGGARHRRDGVRHLGRDELHRGAREAPRRDLLLAGRPRVGSARWRVVPCRREARPRGSRPDHGGVRREDGRGRQPRHPDQDPGRGRPGCAAGGGLPDGARTRVGHGDLVLPRGSGRRTSRWRTSGSSTPPTDIFG